MHLEEPGEEVQACCMGASEENRQENPVIPGRWHALMIASDTLLSTFEWSQIRTTSASEQ